MLTLDFLRKELVNIELECIDREYFESLHKINLSILDMGKLIVNYVQEGNELNSYTCGVMLHNHSDGNIDDEDCFITEKELKYFRIKQHSPTFYDLIDVVVQAIKDDVLTNKVIKISDYLIEMNINGRDRLFNSKNAEDGISFIKSLYTETFVIGEFDDLKKINLKNSVVKFLNGFESEIKSVDWQSDGGNISLYDGKFYVDFDIIKGATVTQKRGEV